MCSTYFGGPIKDPRIESNRIESGTRTCVWHPDRELLERANADTLVESLTRAIATRHAVSLTIWCTDTEGGVAGRDRGERRQYFLHEEGTQHAKMMNTNI